jgi:hypothetical protein
MIKNVVFLFIAAMTVSACSCKDWGYCAHIFPNAERFAHDAPAECPAAAQS